MSSNPGKGKGTANLNQGNAMITFKQCDILTARMDFTYVNPSTSRNRKVRKGEEFWVVSTAAYCEANGTVGIAKKGQSMASAVYMPINMITDLFTLMS